MDLLGDLPAFVLACVLFVVALFFFLKDGLRMVRGWEELTPMDADHDRLIRHEFYKVCRGVVWATVVAALVQGLLFALGLFVIDFVFGVGFGAWVFPLALVTVIFAMIPFLGAVMVWLPTAAVLFFRGDYGAALAVALYGGLFVSQIDTVIRIYVLKDTANLHPLLVFVCVFGGIRLFGILGIFVGPIVGAVLFALLRILKKEIVQFGKEDNTPRQNATG
jgi:predicted PurR-regulated permease PerM